MPNPPGVDAGVRRDQPLAGWIAALLGWDRIVVVLAVYGLLDVAGVTGMSYVERLRGRAGRAPG